MNKTKIEWTDYSWNPVTGCLNNCQYCYAKRMYQKNGRSFKPEFHEDRLNQPLNLKGSKKIFVCSVADLFGDWIPKEWIDNVFSIVKKCPNHTFQFLTKNPKRLLEFSPYPENAWMGCTATSQEMAENSIFYLSKIRASIRFLSCEPLLSKIIISPEDMKIINWLIIGACTGHMASQPQKEWVETLTSIGRQAGCAIFFKPNLIHPNPPHEFPDDSALFRFL